MKLNQLLTESNINTNTINNALLNKTVQGIATNSNLVQEGYIFIAIKGYTTDGHFYLKDALKKGALAVIVEKSKLNFIKNNEFLSNYLSKVIVVENTSSIISKLSKAYYNNLPNNIIAITGTNGKTSVSSMVSQILNYLGINCAQIGTLGTFFNGLKQTSLQNLTTPTVEEIFHICNKAKQNNINYVVIEASSEGIDQGRLNLLPIKIAAFTNLSQDHLNYHKNMENYFSSKSNLFIDILNNQGIAIINEDDYYGKMLIHKCKTKKITTLTYGTHNVSLKLINKQIVENGYKVYFLYEDVEYSVNLKLLGNFQVYNLLCALLIVLSLKIANIEKILKAVSLISGIPGRLELVKIYNEAKVFIDYAHTPDALERVLKSLRELTNNKLYVVFGCGGNRDKQKRKQMGSIANKLADFSYITDDNPRYEDPKNIRDSIILGYNTNNYISIDNREYAITYAMSLLKKGDILLVAGKGHEEFQILKDKVINYSDKNVILNVKE